MGGGGGSNGGVGPGAFSDRGCLPFRVDLVAGGLPGWVCMENVTNVVSIFQVVLPRFTQSI